MAVAARIQWKFSHFHWLSFWGADQYEEEEHLFFRDLSDEGIGDDVFARLLTFPNVLITAHQGFFTEEALHNIADTVIANLDDFAAGRTSPNIVKAEQVHA
jgi:D-lactate dehydrogenase